MDASTNAQPQQQDPPARPIGLITLEVFIGASAVIGSLLLVVRPDGSLLHAEVSALEGSPFSEWLLPGVLLTVLVGGGFLVAGGWLWVAGRYARELSLVAGCGLVLVRAGGTRVDRVPAARGDLRRRRPDGGRAGVGAQSRRSTGPA
ncbi:MAG: hypothetical protein H0V07_11010 [Propionibacteriales bacterium]|nr:hypothetical protein [Propionibacteriales bacterium]